MSKKNFKIYMLDLEKYSVIKICMSLDSILFYF